jgi:hypothetical protein
MAFEESITSVLKCNQSDYIQNLSATGPAALLYVVGSDIVGDSTNNPPHEQWLARLHVGTGSLSPLFFGQPSQPFLKMHPMSSGS